MDKKLQDLVWSVLPKEFKEEVKYKYNKTKTKKIKKECDLGLLNAHEGMFGAHNLTSDAEGEEMLCVKASKVREMYALNENILYLDSTHKGAILLKKKLTDLFGSKCLPDEVADEDNFVSKEPRIEAGKKESFTHPKFRTGDTVLFNNNICRIIGTNREDAKYQLERIIDNHLMGWTKENEISLYEEPKPAEPTENYMQVDYHGADTAASTIADGCQSQPVTDCHDFDNIVNRGFRDHNRLHIAAQIVAAIYANNQAVKGFKSIEEIVRKALDIADALIKKSEKGGK